MTPKEKAMELVSSFYPFVYPYNGSDMLTNTTSKEPIVMNSKQCALIAVNEILNMLENGLYDVNIRGDEYVGELNMVEYFEQVKEEIVNLK